MATEILVNIEEDGTVTMTTEEVGKEIHVQADEMFKEIEKLLGGTKTVTPNKDKHQRVHTHGHIHHRH